MNLKPEALNIPRLKARAVPLVIDADGLWLIERRPELVQGQDSGSRVPSLSLTLRS